MIVEKEISEDILKLAESKGFNRMECQKPFQIDKTTKFYAPITLTFLQTWLREEYKIICYVEPLQVEIWDFNCYYASHVMSNLILDEDIREEIKLRDIFNTYEEALEDSVIFGLNLIPSEEPIRENIENQREICNP